MCYNTNKDYDISLQPMVVKTLRKSDYALEKESMRDVNRLDEFYGKMKELHATYVPDWRFGQMAYNFIATAGDPFYWEEDRFLEKLEEYLKGYCNHD